MQHRSSPSESAILTTSRNRGGYVFLEPERRWWLLFFGAPMIDAAVRHGCFAPYAARIASIQHSTSRYGAQTERFMRATGFGWWVIVLQTNTTVGLDCCGAACHYHSRRKPQELPPGGDEQEHA